MTDSELRDAAVAELKLTTAGWRKRNGDPNYPSGEAPASTHWAKAMSYLEQIGQAPTPPADGLTWAPPPLGTNLTTVVPWTLTRANVASFPTNGNGKDLRLRCSEVLLAREIQLTGWRHIEAIGGEQKGDTLLSEGLAIRDNQVAHIEGWKVWGAGIADAYMVRAGNKIVQLQNCIAESHKQSGEHADNLQTQAPGVDELLLDRFHGKGDYQGIFMRPGVGYVRRFHFKRCFMDDYGGGTGTFLWVTKDDREYPSKVGPGILEDFWIADTGDLVDVMPTHDFQAGGGLPGRYVSRYGSYHRQDAQGRFIKFTDGTGTVPAGGPVSGQPTADCEIAGVVRIGTPPAFVLPSGTPGLSYVSPGYS